jgi:hypothetical protein
MVEHNAQNVGAAFDVLIEEMEDALRSMNNSGANALEVCDYDMAQRTIEHARRVKLLYEKITALKGEWNKLEGTLSVQAVPEKHTPCVTHELQSRRSLPHPGTVDERCAQTNRLSHPLIGG